MNSIKSKGLISIPALGRPFRPGRLYDCRTDKLITGNTLWDNEFLQHHIVSQPQESSNFKIHTEESIADKANAFDIDGNLKLSFLAGLVKVSGSAKYLSDCKSSNYKARVSMQYKCTTKYEELTMEHLGKGKIMYPGKFENGIATHVVTGITYGAQAFFVFEKQFTVNETRKKVHGELNVAIDVLQEIAANGRCSVELTECQKDKVDGFQCTFYGDFIPPTNPTTYIDAVELYKELPKLMGVIAEKSVPVHVRLYPLEHLDSKAAKLVREISVNLVERAENTIEHLQYLEIKCKDLEGSNPCQKFPKIRYKITNFKERVEEYKITFQKQIMEVLPDIRGGVTEEIVLTNILKRRKASPFSHRHLSKWMEDVEGLVEMLRAFISSTNEIPFVDSITTRFNTSIRYVFCFSICLIQKDKLLTDMQSYLRRTTYTGYKYDEENVSSDSFYNDMVQNARQFQTFAAANKGSSETHFIIQEDKEQHINPQFFIFMYKDGKLVDENFKPPSDPGKPTYVESTHHSIQLEWKVPDQGVANITHYEVSYKQISDSEADGSGLWTTVSTSNKECLFTADALKIASEYLFQVKAVCEAGVSTASVVSKPMTTRPTCPPCKPEVQLRLGLIIGVKWSSPDIIADNVKIRSYNVQYCMLDTTDELIEADKLVWCDEKPVVHKTLEAEHRAMNNNIYRYRICANCGDAGQSQYSPISEDIRINFSPEELTKEHILQKSRLVHKGSPSVFALELREVVRRESENIHKYEFGYHKESITPIEKVIMFVGATGAGKTTLINGLINYAFGVKWEDRYRFKLVHEEFQTTQATSQTTSITSYTIHHQDSFQVPYNLTIIDTPGFGDTSGISRDKEITKQIHSFFSTKGVGGIDHIDAIGFVAQASLARLTPTQRYVFDSILSLFGKDIADNIFILVTFADGQKPPVMSSIKKAEFPHKACFKFNNSALFAQNYSDGEGEDDGEKDEEEEEEEEGEEEDGEFNKMVWQMGTKSYKRFLDKLGAIEPKSLVLTKGVLDERSQLDTYIVGIQSGIQTGLNKLEQLKKEGEVLKQHQEDIDRNKNFKYTVEEEVAVCREISAGTYITNCLTCNRTCHYPCGIPQEKSKRRCSAMTLGNCRVCPNKCNWKMHTNMSYKIEIEKQTVTKDSEDLKQRYEDAKGAKMSAEQIMNDIAEEFDDVQYNVLVLTGEIRKSLNRLQEIALLPNPLSSVEYIDILIQSQKHEAKPGWFQNVEQLQYLRKNAEVLKIVEKEDLDLFKEYERFDDTQPRKCNEGKITRFKRWCHSHCKSVQKTVLQYSSATSFEFEMDDYFNLSKTVGPTS